MFSETFRTSYEVLFRVQVLHRYFLNVGTVPFDAPAPAAAVQAALAAARRAYDVAQFWRVAPDAATRETLRNHRLLFKPLPDGFRVGVPTNGAGTPAEPLPPELTLRFVVTLADDRFALYTDLDRAVLDALAQPAPPAVPGAVPQQRVFAWANAAGSLALNAHETIGLADLRPHPADGPARPLGLIDIRHRAVGGPSLLTGTGRLASPTFGAVLRNRTTRWEYQHTDLGAFPLVRAGRVAVSGGTPAQPLPNPTPATTADRGTAFVSVIY